MWQMSDIETLAFIALAALTVALVAG